ncbi:hypothetical protein GGE65_008386 [Skermanella aerolata]|uniref:AAA family ATPase n=1 Tax=Skermanella aerolata TaxID=393310 RepID=UPI003D2184D4
MPRDSSTMTAEDLAHKLGATRRGRGWKCHCPAHEDKKASLDIDEGEGGKILLKCRAHCDQGAVMDALRTKGLWGGTASPGSASGGNGHSPRDEAVLLDVISAGAPVLDVESLLISYHAVERRGGKLVHITEQKDGPPIIDDVHRILRFDVKDRKGRLLYVEARIEFGWQDRKGRPDKTHRPITLWRLADDRLEWKAKGYRKSGPLFGLEMLDTDPAAAVVIHEGPGKVEAGRRVAPQFIHLGLMGGTQKAGHADMSPLSGRDTILWLDADQPGEKATAELRKRITEIGARSVSAISPPAGVPKGWGIDDLAGQEAAGDDAEALIAAALQGADAHKRDKRDMSEDEDLFELLDLDDMAALPDPDWLVEDMVPQTAMTLIFGASDNFKSFLALDLALSVATGRKWQGREVKQGAVIYLASEGAIGVGKQRVRGWLSHYGVRGKPPFFLLRQEVLLNDPAGLKKLMATIDAKLGGELALIVCDVLSGTRKGSEVDDEAAAAHVRALQTLVRTYGASVMSVTHTGWSDPERARGHTHTWGSYDTRLKVEGDKESLRTTLTVNRHKDADAGVPMTFNMLPVPVPGMTVQKGMRKGEPITTLVPIWNAEAEPVGKRDKAGQSKMSASVKTTLDQLRNAVIDAGTAPPPGMKDIPKSVLVVSKDLLRQRCYSAGISGSDTTQSAKRKAFDRAIDTLKTRGIMAEWEGLVWIVKEVGDRAGQAGHSGTSGTNVPPGPCPARDRQGHVSLDMSRMSRLEDADVNLMEGELEGFEEAF